MAPNEHTPPPDDRAATPAAPAESATPAPAAPAPPVPTASPAAPRGLAPERLVPEEGPPTGREDVKDFLLNVGPHHPGTHGVLRLVVHLDGEQVVGVDPRIGYMHRSLEKIAENRGYHQVIAFTDRTPDYLGPMFNDWVYCMAAEQLLDVTVPERAQYLRVIVGELNRITSHLLSLGALGIDTGATTYFLWCFAARERLVRLFEELCGARLTYVYMRLGGVSCDVPDGEWLARVDDAVHGVVAELPEFRTLFHDNYIWHQRSKGISVLSAAEALRLGAQGPLLRAAGVAWDLRRDMPYSVYDRFEFSIPVGTTGDVYDRTEVRFLEIIESAKIIRQAIRGLPGGNVLAHRIPRVPAPPPGEAYARVESPRGELGCYLVSDGTHKPYRMKWRAPSFYNVSMLPDMAVGYTLSDLINILGTIDPVMGDVDK